MKNKRRNFLKKTSLVSLGVLTANESLYASPNKLSAKSYSNVSEYSSINNGSNDLWIPNIVPPFSLFFLID